MSIHILYSRGFFIKKQISVLGVISLSVDEGTSILSLTQSYTELCVVTDEYAHIY